MSLAVDSPFKLQNREIMDILESYLGDEAHYFKWKDRQYVESDHIGPNKSHHIVLRASLAGYPSDSAKIRLKLLILSTGNSITAQFDLGSIEINDPSGPKLFNMKVKTVMVAFNGSFGKELNLEGE
jgi:hypothetical protein